MHASIDLLRSKAQEMLDRRRRENEQKASKSSNSGSSGNEEAEDAFDVANRQHTDLLTVMLESKDENGELAFNDKNCIDNVSGIAVLWPPSVILRALWLVPHTRDLSEVVRCSPALLSILFGALLSVLFGSCGSAEFPLLSSYRSLP